MATHKYLEATPTKFLEFSKFIRAAIEKCLNDLNPLQVDWFHIVRVLGQYHQVGLLAHCDATHFFLQVKLPCRVDGVGLESLVDGHAVLWAVWCVGVVPLAAGYGCFHVGEGCGLARKCWLVLVGREHNEFKRLATEICL